MLSDILKALDRDGRAVRWRTVVVVEVEVVSNEERGRLVGNRGICVVAKDGEWCRGPRIAMTNSSLLLELGV